MKNYGPVLLLAAILCCFSAWNSRAQSHPDAQYQLINNGGMGPWLYRLNTATATIGIRGTIFGVTVCLPATCGSLAPGTYVNVIDGRVAIAPPLPVLPVIPVPGMPTPPVAPPAALPGAPRAAPVVLAAGQFGYVPLAGPPVVLPSNPGIQFTPPPSFTARPEAPPPGPQQPGTQASSFCGVKKIIEDHRL